MPNRTGRARHLTLVPDIPAEPSGTAPHFDDVVAAVPPGIVQLTLDVYLSHVPAVQRTIRVRSDLLLPEFHTVLQAAMGWGGREHYMMTTHEGSALHTYCTPSVLAAGEAGQLGDHVRIDVLIGSAGDMMQYRYGSWVHVVRVRSVDTDIDDLRPTCLDGYGVCPLEEGVDEILAHPLREAETGSTVDSANDRLRRAWRSRTPQVESAAASASVARVLRRTGDRPIPQLIELLPRCELTIESSVDLPVARVAMSKLTWFLGCVGERGIGLTADGHLPPAIVEAVRDELEWGIGWVGDSLRESDHHQATDLREAARSLGLVRVLRGKLVRTKAGTLLSEDAVGLWHHTAARLPLGRADHEQDSGTLYLVALAASASAERRDEMVVESMNALGWGDVDAFESQKAAHATVAFLDLIGAHGPLFYLGSTGSEAPSWARRFARDALRTRRTP